MRHRGADSRQEGRVVWTAAPVLGTSRYRLGFAAKYALMN